MSAWRIALQQLYAQGGQALCHDFGEEDSRCQLARKGLAISPGRFVTDKPWRITPLGIEVVQGKVTRVVRRGKPGYWRPTWLSALAERRT